jgi:hypothetical protein
MVLFWHIRYFDSGDRQFKDRDLWLVTEELDPTTRVAVESCYEMEGSGGGRGMLRYRGLFRQSTSPQELDDVCHRSHQTASVVIHDYVEDEIGRELAGRALATALTGSPGAVLVPAGAGEHDIDYIISEKPPIDVGTMEISAERLQVLAYFARDLSELAASAFMKDRPASLTCQGSEPPVLHTAATDEEIKSFLCFPPTLHGEGAGKLSEISANS